MKNLIGDLFSLSFQMIVLAILKLRIYEITNGEPVQHLTPEKGKLHFAPLVINLVRH
jgi:hypothetical protein